MGRMPVEALPKGVTVRTALDQITIVLSAAQAATPGRVSRTRTRAYSSSIGEFLQLVLLVILALLFLLLLRSGLVPAVVLVVASIVLGLTITGGALWLLLRDPTQDTLPSRARPLPEVQIQIRAHDVLIDGQTYPLGEIREVRYTREGLLINDGAPLLAGHHWETLLFVVGHIRRAAEQYRQRAVDPTSAEAEAELRRLLQHQQRKTTS